MRDRLTDEGRPSDRSAGTGAKPPSVAVVKSHGREPEGEGLAETGSGHREEEDRKGTTMEVSKVKR